MIQKTIRRIGIVVSLAFFALILVSATTFKAEARNHRNNRSKSGRHTVHARAVRAHGKSRQNARHNSKHYARLSRRNVPQKALTTTEKSEIVQKIRELAKSSVSTGDALLTNEGKAQDDSLVAAETTSPEILKQIAQAAKEEQAEDDVDVSIDQFFKARPGAVNKQSDAMQDALDPALAVERQDDYTLFDQNDPTRAAQRSDVMAEIINWIGTRYSFGGVDRCGIDCSAFTREVFDKAFGLDLPRTAYMQSQLGDPVEKQKLQFGDLVFFKTAGYAPITHVGIYIGEGLFANAACSRGVTVASLESEYWSKHYVSARRLVANNGLASASVPQTEKVMAVR
jgi:cell wall-associated NlpC family hydrolase